MSERHRQRCAIGLAIGITLGVAGARFILVGSWLNLLLWGVAGAGLGAWARSVRGAAVAGAVYGFGLTFAFMVAGYTGAASLASRLLPFAIIAAFGAACGGALAALSASILRRVTQATVNRRR